MIYIAPHINISESEINITAVRAQGAGGQNVNKVSSAIHLRFDIRASALPDAIKQRLLELNDQRITNDGVIIIKAQEFRNQEQNRTEALRRLKSLIQGVAFTPKKRIATRPTASSRAERLARKSRRSNIKSLRSKLTSDS